MSNLKSEFADRLLKARLDLRLTQDALAKKWGFSGGNYIYMLEAGKKPFPRHLEDQVIELEREAAKSYEKSHFALSEKITPYGAELDEQALHIGLNLIFEKLDPRQISQLIKEVNNHARISQSGKTFWIQVLSDWLQIKLAGKPSSTAAKKDADQIAVEVSESLQHSKKHSE